MAKDPRVTRIEDLPGPKSKGELDEMKMPYEEYCRKAFGPGNEWAKPDALKGIRWLSSCTSTAAKGSCPAINRAPSSSSLWCLIIPAW